MEVIESQAVDVRVVVATNRVLAAAVREGTFREDLYYRLNVLTIQVPPLRERPGDILFLARHFLADYARDLTNRRESGSRGRASGNLENGLEI